MFRRLISAAVCIFLLAAGNAYCAEIENYVTIHDYLSAHPEQRKVMESFTAAVYGPGVPVPGIKQRTAKIAVVYPALQKSDYWRANVKAMEMRLKELNIRYELLTYFSKPSGDFRLQVIQITDAIKAGADYIVLSVDNESIKRLISTVLAKNNVRIIIQNLTTPLEDWEATPPYLYVGFDHMEGSKLIADRYSNHFPKGARYLLLYGTHGTVSDQRGDGFESYSLSKGMTAAAKFYTDYSSEKAYDAVMTSIKRGTEFSFVYACSTDIAIGAAKAIADAGLTGKIMVNGWGGTLSELELLKKGMLDFTVMRMNDDSAVAIAEAVKNGIAGNPGNTPQIFSGKFVTATSGMPAEAIDKLAERALRYSGR